MLMFLGENIEIQAHWLWNECLNTVGNCVHNMRNRP